MDLHLITMARFSVCAGWGGGGGGGRTHYKSVRAINDKIALLII